MSKKKSTFDEKITSLQAVMTDTAKKIFTPDGTTQMVPATYADCRREINRLLVEICLGAEFEKKKDGAWTVKMCHKLPDRHQLADVSELLGSYIQQYERPLLDAFVSHGLMDRNGNVVNSQNPVAAAGMEIPPNGGTSTGVAAGPMSRRVTFIDDVSHKKIRDAAIGGGEFSGYLNMYLQVSDLVVMTANASRMRKKDRKKRMLIAGGIAIVVAAGVGVAAFLYCKHKKKSNEEMVDDLVTSAEDMCMDVSDTGVDDAPVVTL